MSISWVDEITPALRVSILMRTYAADFPFAALALQSAQRFFSGAIEFVVVVPEDDAKRARQELPSNIVLYAEARQLHDDAIQHKLTKMLADKYCQGDYVFHLDSDSLFHRPVLRRDLFIFDKPILAFDRYRNVEWKEDEARKRRSLPARDNFINGSRVLSATRWQAGTAHAVGHEVEFEFSRANDHIFHRRVYAEAREHLERIHSTTLTSFLNTRRGDMRGWKGEAPATAAELFSDYNYLGAFLYYHRPELMSWTYLGTEAVTPKYSLPYEYSSIRPDVVCQGNSHLKAEGQMATQLAIMSRVVAGQSPCRELTAFVGQFIE